MKPYLAVGTRHANSKLVALNASALDYTDVLLKRAVLDIVVGVKITFC